MTDSEILLEKVKNDILAAFSHLPEYGSIGFSITLQDKEPVRVECTRSILKKLPTKSGYLINK